MTLENVAICYTARTTASTTHIQAPRHPSESWDLMPSGAPRREQTGAASTQVEHPLRPCSCPPPLQSASSPGLASGCFPWGCSRRCRRSSSSPRRARSEEHTSELQSLMRISYAVFCLKKKNLITHTTL